MSSPPPPPPEQPPSGAQPPSEPPPPGQVPYGYGYPPQGQVPYGYGPPTSGYPGQVAGYGPRPARNGLAITALVLGIAALALCWTTLPGIILGVLAIIFGAVALARARTDKVSNKGMAIAGLITGVLGLIIGVVLFVAAIRIASDCQDRFGTDISDAQLERCIGDIFGV